MKSDNRTTELTLSYVSILLEVEIEISHTKANTITHCSSLDETDNYTEKPTFYVGDSKRVEHPLEKNGEG